MAPPHKKYTLWNRKRKKRKSNFRHRRRLLLIAFIFITSSSSSIYTFFVCCCSHRRFCLWSSSDLVYVRRGATTTTAIMFELTKINRILLFFLQDWIFLVKEIEFSILALNNFLSYRIYVPYELRHYNSFHILFGNMFSQTHAMNEGRDEFWKGIYSEEHRAGYN